MIGLSVFLMLTMPERRFRSTPHPQRVPLQTMAATLRESVTIIRASRVILILLLVSLVAGAFSEGYDRLWEAHMLAHVAFPLGSLLPVVIWFGAITVAMKLVNLLATEAILRRFDLDDVNSLSRILQRTTIGVVAGVVVFGISSNFAVAVGALLVVELLRNLQAPLNETWLNKSVPARIRATILSMNSQVDSLGQVVGGPIIGAVGMFASLRTAMLVNALLFLPALILYRRATTHALTHVNEQPSPEML